VGDWTRRACRFERFQVELLHVYGTLVDTTLLKGDLVSEVTRLKQESGPDLVILGSGSLVSELTEVRLIDAYQIVVNPIVLGRGRTLFETIGTRLPLRLVQTRSFATRASAGRSHPRPSALTA